MPTPSLHGSSGAALPRGFTSQTGAIACVREALRESISLHKELLMQASTIVCAAALIGETLRAGGKVMLCGNGGSAADAQHIAAELTGRFSERRRPGLAALALTTDTSALTSIANDFGYEHVFARQIEAIGRREDLLFAISTSGRSANILAAARQAREQGLRVLALTGQSAGALAGQADFVLSVPGRTSDRIQELHIAVGHILCTLVEAEIFG